ncbi:MAG: helix-turn-helix domain-containing protein [Clostridia bacterium]|nr:helix-turn-helix domain-containing protein [Clostridia bacterium]
MEYKIFESMIHPIRIKIIQEILKKENATVRDIAEAVSDVPQASLYRHINKLLNENIIEVVAENKVRGTLEKVYKIRTDPYEEINKAVQSNDPKQLLNLYYNFTMNLLSDFENYLKKDKIDLAKDGVGFRTYPIYLSEEEFVEVMTQFGQALQKHLDNKPDGNRKLRKISTIITPVED